MANLEEVVLELAETQRRLDELPADAFLEKLDLKDHLNDLRAEAASLRAGSDAEGSNAQLLERLANLRLQRDTVEKSQIDVVKQAGTLTAGLSGTTHQGDATRLNRQIRHGRGITQIEEQIAETKRVLSDRGVDPG
jgi:hypothetical protein